jgi:hypothetical protein
LGATPEDLPAHGLQIAGQIQHGLFRLLTLALQFAQLCRSHEPLGGLLLDAPADLGPDAPPLHCGHRQPQVALRNPLLPLGLEAAVIDPGGVTVPV